MSLIEPQLKLYFLSIIKIIMRSSSVRSLMSINYTEMKERQKNYDFHVRKIMQIETTNHNKKILNEQVKFADHLRKSKETAKKYQQERELTKRHQQDKKMIFTLMEIHKKPRIKSEISKLQKKIDSLPVRTASKEKLHQQEKIQNQNVRLTKSILTTASGAKIYKKKMKTEIDQYIRLRTHLQKFRPEEAPIDKSRKSVKTANELMSLIKQKTEEIQRNRSKIHIQIPQSSREEDLTQKQLELLV